MAVGLQSILIGIGWLAVIALAPSVLFLIVVKVPRVLEAVRERRAARRRAGQPTGRPVEALAADLRRLRAELVSRRPTNNVRHTGLLAAYDDVLVAMCGRLEIATPLGELAHGRDRDVERLRAEAAVQDAGIRLDPPRDRYDRPAQP